MTVQRPANAGHGIRATHQLRRSQSRHFAAITLVMAWYGAARHNVERDFGRLDIPYQQCRRRCRLVETALSADLPRRPANF